MSAASVTSRPEAMARDGSQLSTYSDPDRGVSRSSTALPAMPGSAHSPSPTSQTPSPQPNIFDVICKEFMAERPPFREPDEESLPPPTPTPLPPRDKCLPREYLESYVFPVLLPALEAMLRAAKSEKCFERKRTKFDALDFLTEYLWTHNPEHTERSGTELGNIPFVADHWKEHPRPPLPKSLLWNEGQAGLIIQNFWRGYQVRREPNVQEMRQWQQEWRAENGNIHAMVNHFWDNQMPEEESARGTPRSARSPARSSAPASPKSMAPQSTSQEVETDGANMTQSEPSTSISCAVP